MQSEVQAIVQRVEALATPLVEEEGIEVWGVDFRPEAGRWVLRLALDREGGVSLDELTRVHRQLSDLLDAHDPVPWRYTLEISSPGIIRPLLRPSHFRRYYGKRVRVLTHQEQQGKRVFIGTVSGVGEDHVVLVDETTSEVQIPWENMRKATTEHDFPVPRSSKKKRRLR